MNIFSKINSLSATFNVTEQKICQFILENYEPLRYMSIQTAAEKSGTSTASLYRLSIKIGFKGFSDLKRALIESYPGGGRCQSYEQLITESPSIEVTTIKLLDSIKQTINATFSFINYSDIEAVTDKIKSSKKIFLFGSGISGLIVDDFRQKIERLGYSVYYTPDPHSMINALSFINENDFLFLVSYSGENNIAIRLATYAKKMNVCVVAVTGIHKNSLSEIVDMILKVPDSESELRLAAINSRYSCMIVMDIIYFYLVSEDIDSVKEKILTTHALARLINGNTSY
ncbi:MurR/RpiR family transcriptional regulator [Vibrio mimicus]|uniref:MurR/RpiR family transcriptional regulator n=1 Tax=Vibrio mimicus TaxID=674 RepID=UPI00076B442C|nr:MurR/RpiR family transcriptional regulator [Vibrio mimicus]AMG03229.1 MurR/RpiR family transcriptional regulator [Vibrio mimicus]KAA3491047.1 MurR/RpiR family transcriptional regulator [Vibrio mimicus]